MKVYKEYNAEYVPQSPIKLLDAELLLDILRRIEINGVEDAVKLAVCS